MTRFLSLLAFSLIVLVPDTNSQWIQQTLPAQVSRISSIDFIDQYHGVAISSEPMEGAFYTTNSGTNWHRAIVADTLQFMTDVQLLGENIGYASANFQQWPISIGLFAETLDGGISWHQKGSMGYDITYVSKIYFTDLQTGYAVVSTSSGNRILKTTNSGNNWNSTNTNLGIVSVVIDIEFVDPFNGIAFGVNRNNPQQGLILTTNNGGESWNSQLHPEFGDLNEVVFLNTNTILISGHLSSHKSAIYKSTDGGNTWNVFHIYDDDQFYLGGVVALPDIGVIICYGSYGINEIPGPPFIEVTLDAGTSWYTELLNEFRFFFPADLKIIDQNKWYIVGGDISGQGVILFTDNAAGIPVELTSFTATAHDKKVVLSWKTATELNNNGFEIQRKTIDGAFATIGFVKGKGTTTNNHDYLFTDKDLIGGKYFYRLKQLDYSGQNNFSQTVEVDVRSLDNFTLEQNYPNPFNPTTTIGYVLQEKGSTKLSLMNVIGEEVTILVDEEQDKGYHKVDLNAQNLPSGIYLYKLQSGNFVETKKLMLLK